MFWLTRDLRVHQYPCPGPCQYEVRPSSTAHWLMLPTVYLFCRHFLPKFPGLIHFVFIDRGACEFFSPRLTSLSAPCTQSGAAIGSTLSLSCCIRYCFVYCAVAGQIKKLRCMLWRSYNLAQQHISTHFPIALSVKYGQTQLTARHWAERHIAVAHAKGGLLPSLWRLASGHTSSQEFEL